jgi:hypothetical protein
MATTTPPSARQLAYLRRPALRTGTTFTPPTTSHQASAEIRRVKAITRTGFTFAELEAEKTAREANSDITLPATAFRDDEVEGFGATATWKGRS